MEIRSLVCPEFVLDSHTMWKNAREFISHASSECVNLRSCEDAIHAEDAIGAGELRRVP